MPKQWRIHPHDADRIAHLERAAGISAVAAQLLVCRGICDPQAARTFLAPTLSGLFDPEDLPGAAGAAERLLAAVAARRKIVIYGDYDVDGMSGTAVLLLALRLLAADVSYYVPNRLDEGYGLNGAALATLAQRGAQVIVTVDCGIASLEEAVQASALGLELIVTDHHSLAAELPAAAEIVHPALPGTAYPFVGLCGAGVAFKLAWALCQRASQSKRVGEPMKNFLLEAVGLVALGTVADMVPLVSENRIFVRHGLVSIKSRPRSAWRR